MGNLFSNKKTTQQTTNSNQSGSTENNLWDNPGLQSFLSGYNNQFQGAANFNAPVNQYQTGAANAQTGVSGGLGSAFQTANQVGSDGITKANIDKYMSPYVQGVINPTMQVQNQQNQQALSNLFGNQAAKGALGNNTGSAAAYMASVQPAQQAQIAGLYQQGYGQATSTAAQDAALRLQGAGTAGSLTGAATGANAALGNMGQNIWQSNYQNQITPYTLYNQGVQGFTGLGGLAGQNYTGTSSGTSNGTSSETPSLGSVLAGLLGTGISAYKADGGPVNDNAPIMPYEPSEAPQETLIDKVLKASHALREFRDGGAATKADGGMVGYDPTKWVTQVHAPSSGPSVDYKKAGAGLSGMGSSLGKMSNDGDVGGSAIAAQQAELGRGLQSIMQRPAFADGGEADHGIGEAMRPFMPSSPVEMEAPSGGVSDVMRPFMPTAPMSGMPPMEPASPRPATAVMGQAYRADPVPSPSMAGATARAQEPSMGSKFYDMIGRPFSGGVWDGKEATAGQRAGAALTQIGNGPFAGFGQHILAQQKIRYDELAAERAAAELMGQYRGNDTLAKQQVMGAVDGKPTVAARTVGIHESMLPADMRLKAAQAQKAEADADKDYQRKLAEDKVRFETEQALAKQKAEMAQWMEIRKQMKGDRDAASGAVPSTNTRMRWVPAPATADAAPPANFEPQPAPAPAAPPPPPTPSRNNRGMIIKGTATAPYENKDQAGFGEYYRASDGKVYRRGNVRSGDTPYYGAP